jgi:hypothetical protein
VLDDGEARREAHGSVRQARAFDAAEAVLDRTAPRRGAEFQAHAEQPGEAEPRQPGQEGRVGFRPGVQHQRGVVRAAWCARRGRRRAARPGSWACPRAAAGRARAGGATPPRPKPDPDGAGRGSARRRFAIRAEAPVFATPGAARAYKGLDPLLSAFVAVREPRLDTRLIVAGRAGHGGCGSRFVEPAPGALLMPHRIDDATVSTSCGPPAGPSYPSAGWCRPACCWPKPSACP